MYSDQQLVLVNGGTLNSNDTVGDERQRNTATIHNNRSQQQIGAVSPVAELVQNANYTNVNGQAQTQATIYLNHNNNNYRKNPPNLQNNVAAVAACVYNNCNNNNNFSNLSFYAQQPTSSYSNNNNNNDFELYQAVQVCVSLSVSPLTSALL